jgi:hypothetical protein
VGQVVEISGRLAGIKGNPFQIERWIVFPRTGRCSTAEGYTGRRGNGFYFRGRRPGSWGNSLSFFLIHFNSLPPWGGVSYVTKNLIRIDVEFFEIGLPAGLFISLLEARSLFRQPLEVLGPD